MQVEIKVQDYYARIPLQEEKDIEYFKQLLEVMCKQALENRKELEKYNV